MRFPANENISGTVIESLRRRGHDVLSAKESLRGESDADLFRRINRCHHAAP